MPPVVWKGNGRKPKENRECLHALLYVLIASIGWELLPAGFPSYKTVQRRRVSGLTCRPCSASFSLAKVGPKSAKRSR